MYRNHGHLPAVGGVHKSPGRWVRTQDRLRLGGRREACRGQLLQALGRGERRGPPLIDELVQGSLFDYVDCGFVSDSDYNDWRWKVRVENPDHVGGWSEPRSFRLQP